jgi:hypothetical protein
MRTLSRREAIAHMANMVVDFLIGERRYQQAIEVAQVILRHAPRDGYTLAKLGSAYGGLLRAEHLEGFASPDLIPADLRPRFTWLARGNRLAFEAAEALGWEPAP